MPSACRVKLGRGKSGRPNACQGGKNGIEIASFSCPICFNLIALNYGYIENGA